jgi:hypothetical protein
MQQKCVWSVRLVRLPHQRIGTVRNSETGAPIAGAQVEGSGRSAITDDSGHYTFACDSCWSYWFWKEGFESRNSRFNGGVGGTPPTSEDITLQPIVQIEAGGAAVTTIYPDDSGIDFSEGNCAAPCRLVRISIVRDGVFDMKLLTDDPNAGLSAMIYKSYDRPVSTGPLHVKAREEMLIVVHRIDSISGPQRFEISTSFLPD